MAAVEDKILTTFQRGAQTYLRQPPTWTNWLEWLATIQHHGGVTRLLDFTRSVYVAAFFAFDESCDHDSAIWCVNGTILSQLMKDQGKRIPGVAEIPWSNEVEGSQVFDHIYGEQKFSGLQLHGFAAMVVQPIRIHERLLIQQGTFLCSVNLNHTLEQNLYGMFGLTPEEVHAPPQAIFTGPRVPGVVARLQRSPVIKIVLDRRLRPEALAELGRMNVAHRSLFPGLDGYARDLKRQAYWHSKEANELRGPPLGEDS